MKFPITSKFNAVENFRESKHLGVDLGLPKDTEIHSIKSGEILKVVDYKNENIGKGIFVKWEDGKTAIYGHLNSTSVNIGDKVEPGTLLGYSGNTGNVFGENGGYHLHFGLKSGNGQFIDPEPYVPLLQKFSGEIDHIVEHSDNLMQLDPSDMLQQALDGLTDIKLNLINLSQLLEIHAVFLKLHAVFLSIF